jgi:hypothetical protein
MQDFPVCVPDYKKEMERLKQDCLDAEEIARPPCSIHDASRTFGNPRMAFDYSSQRP